MVNDLRGQRLRWPLIVAVCQKEWTSHPSPTDVKWDQMSLFINDDILDSLDKKKRSYRGLDGRVMFAARQWWDDYGESSSLSIHYALTYI